MMNSDTHYEDAFVSCMHYLSMRLDDTGTKRRINTKEDLRRLFEEINKQEKANGKKPRMSKAFIDSVLGTNTAEEAVKTGTLKDPVRRGHYTIKNHIVGHFGNVFTYAQGKRHEETDVTLTEAVKIAKYREKGSDLYRYDGGVAVVFVQKTKNDHIIKRFRDVDTGRFVSGKKIKEEL